MDHTNISIYLKMNKSLTTLRCGTNQRNRYKGKANSPAARGNLSTTCTECDHLARDRPPAVKRML
jgi:hypothetical protein